MEKKEQLYEGKAKKDVYKRQAQGIQLETYGALALVLTRLDKGAGDIAVLDETDAVRNAGELRDVYKRQAAHTRVR